MTSPHLLVRAAALAGAGVLAVAGLAGCGDDSSAAANTDNAVSVKARDYAFDVSGPLQAGVSTITFSNEGKEIHEMAIVKLKSGVSLDQVKDALLSDDESAAGAVLDGDPSVPLGTPGLLAPGASTTVATRGLTAGTYALVCFIPGPDGAPHATKGMVNELKVNGTSDVDAPDVDGTVTMTEYAFSSDVSKLSDGETTLAVKNDGKQQHDLTIVKLAEGKSVKDASEYFDALFSGQKPAGPPAAELYGGVAGVAPGKTVWLSVDLPKGRYAALSVSGDEGKQDFSKGMQEVFTVD